MIMDGQHKYWLTTGISKMVYKMQAGKFVGASKKSVVYD